MAPIAFVEQKRFKESAPEASRKARNRAKMLQESKVKLEPLSSKKRRRTNLSCARGGRVNLTKPGSQVHKTHGDASNQTPEAKTTSSMWSKWIRRSVTDVQLDSSRSATAIRHKNEEKKDESPVRAKEKTCRLLAGDEVLDKKIKKKRSTGARRNRVTTGNRDVKRTSHAKGSVDLKMWFYDSQGFRENTQKDCQSSSLSIMIKSKDSQAPQTGSVTALILSNVKPSSGTLPGSSVHQVSQWDGERPHKNSRSRRVNVVSPVSCCVEAQVSSEGCPSFDFSHKDSSVVSSGYHLETRTEKGTQKYKRSADNTLRLGLSESEEFGVEENKLIEKGINSSEFAPSAKKDGYCNLQIRKNKIPTDEFGDWVQRKERTGRNLSLTRPGLASGRVKSENLTILKPVENTRPADKSKMKYGCSPSKKQKDCKVPTHAGKMHNNGSSDFAGSIFHECEYDDTCEELYKAAKSSLDASNLACSGLFWEEMESSFATISEESVSFLKQQMTVAEELDKTLSQMLCIDHIMDDIMNNEATHCSEERQRSFCDRKGAKTDTLTGKCNGERLDNATPLFKLLCSAIISEDGSEESYLLNEAMTISQKCPSDDSHCDPCNQFDLEPRYLDKTDFEVESEPILQIQKNFPLDREMKNFSHSDFTYNRDTRSNDLDQLQPAELSGGGFPMDNDYQRISLDDKLLLELHSIGLYPEILPDLAEEDEAKNQNIVVPKEKLCEQIGRKKNFDTTDRSIKRGRDPERQKIVQVVFDQLIEMAYRKILARLGSKNSEGAGMKVSKQVALGFVKRALGSCKIYEETGNSCFSEPDLRHIILSTHSCESVEKSAGCAFSGLANNTCNKASDLEETSKAGAVSGASEKFDSHIDDDVDDGPPGFLQGSSHLSEQVSSRSRPRFMKKKKREMLVNGVGGGGSSTRAMNLNGLVNFQVKGKRSRRDRNRGRDQSGKNAISSLEAKETASLSQSGDNAGGNNGRDGTALCGSHDTSKGKQCSGSGNLQPPELDSMENTGLSGDLGGHQDIGGWLNIDDDDLADHDLIGLQIPMDDLSEIM